MQIDPKLRHKILQLCNAVDEVLHNNDWPTEAGTMVETETDCTCPIMDLTRAIREGLLQ